MWDDERVRESALGQLGLLHYRSNLLGADLRITNFGGGNTSSKIELPDPFTGKLVRVLAVKGSGGDLGSIKESGFALLHLDRLEQLKKLYRGEAHEEEMVQYYALAAFGENRVAASIDTALHAFLPFPHVDHLHPDWAIALAASANGKRKLEEFNGKFGRNIVWLPWQRPGFELALMLECTVKENPRAEGILLGSHGLFTWGHTQRECYLNSIYTIDQMGQFIHEHQAKKGLLFGGLAHTALPEREKVAAQILPALRGALSSNCRVIAHYSDHRADYKKYYDKWATSDSPKLRDSNPSVVIVPGLGLFGFGKNKKEARIATEFFLNAIHVMAGANALEDKEARHPLPQARRAEQSTAFEQFRNYVALPRSEAFRIEYWALEEAKLQRMPSESEFSRRILLVIGGASGIGRKTALLLTQKGAHIVIADADSLGARKAAEEAGALATPEFVAHTAVELGSPESLAEAVKFTVLKFGGIDGIVNTAAIYPVREAGSQLTPAQWAKTFLVNVTGNYLLARESEWVFTDQNLPATLVLTGSANAVVPKNESEAYDTSKAALNHLIRELAIRLGPQVRVNGIAPATVVADSTMFPRDRVIQSLRKYAVGFSESESTEDLRAKLAEFYALRTLTKQPILPQDCANAIVWLASDQSAKTTGHVIPVDGGLSEAFLR